jgi:hypothetical protein
VKRLTTHASFTAHLVLEVFGRDLHEPVRLMNAIQGIFKPAGANSVLALTNPVNPEHMFAGAQMRDRIVGALETGCRLGGMLKIQNRHVLWDTH